MKCRHSVLVLAAGAGMLAGASTAGAQLLYSFETLYNDMGQPDPLGTRPDGFHTNPVGPSTSVTQDTFGVTDGAHSLKFSQILQATFTGAITELGVPFPLINSPSTSAISMDLTVKAGEEFVGGFANLGLTEFGEHPTFGEGQAQTIAAVEQIIKLEPGTYRLVIPLIARNRPYDPFELDISFSDIVNTGTNPMTPTSFQFYVNKGPTTGGDPLPNAPLTVYVDNMRAVTANSAAWKLDQDGDWSDAANWAGAPVAVPHAVDAIGFFGLAISAPRTLSMNQPHTVGELIFNHSVQYTIGGPSALTVDVSSGQGRIAVYTGSHVIAAPVVLNDNVTLDVARSTSVLTVSGPMTAAGRTITKSGTGRADLSPLNASGLTINGGTVRLLPDGTAAGTSRVNNLTIAGGTSPTATLDLTNNAMVVNYDPPADAQPFDTIEAQVANAFAGGAWTGAGITSSQANSNQLAVGLAEASDLPSVPAIFGSVDATAVLLRLTRYGDANLDGVVNLADFNRLAGNFGSTSGDWVDGDFNYDNLVNLSDFNRLAGNFGLSATGRDAPTAADWAALAAAVPEPGVASFVLGVGALACRARNRVRRRR